MKWSFLAFVKDNRLLEFNSKKEFGTCLLNPSFLPCNAALNKKVMKSLLETDAYEEIKARLNALHEKSERQWGKMTVGQMAWHCQYPLKLAIENKENSSNGNWFIKTFFKKSLYNDKPWRKNLPTAPQLKAKEPKEFSTEIEELKSLVDKFQNLKDRDMWYPHPAFGKFTKAQWGQMQYKHLDHHLRQFGV
jgi:hypothetical protein